MNGKLQKQAAALVLALTMLLSLSACAQKAEQTPAGSEPGAALNLTAKKAEKTQEASAADSAKQSMPSGRAAHAQKIEAPKSGQTQIPAAWTQIGEASLAQLRTYIGGAPVMFGAAYLGYVGGLFEGGFELEFPTWLRENNQTLLEEYPFIGEIDVQHIIGGAGHLYCIVPVDENATIAVNRVKWNENTQTYEVTEVLYRAEAGDPVLLFASLDGVAYETDTQVFITDNNGSTCEWYPSLDAEGCLVPCMMDGECHSWDFTSYQFSSAEDLSAWLVDGWLGPTALGLAGSDDWGMTWCTSGTAWDTGRSAYFMLTFYPGDETGGRVDLDWLCDGETEYEERWSGFWTIETELDMPSRVTLSLSLVGGRSYGTTDGPMYISDTYRMMTNRRGESLLIAAGENSVYLPFLAQNTTACVLMLAYG